MMIHNRAQRCMRVFVVLFLLAMLLGLSVPITASAQDEPPTVPQGDYAMDIGSGVGAGAEGEAPAGEAPVGEAPVGEAPAGEAPVGGDPAAGPALAAGSPANVPDNFGYIWQNASWTGLVANVVTAGNRVPLTGVQPLSGPISIGFPFRFYENSYTNVYISGSGYLTFNNAQVQDNQSPLLVEQQPNDVIAPFWGPAVLGNGSTTVGQIYRSQRGATPNRSFVIQWNQISQVGAVFTYQVELYENGKIRFNYGTMSYPQDGGGYYCTTSGIEDSRGTDGLIVDSFCTRAATNRSVEFIRPADARRAHLTPDPTGMFVRPNQPAAYNLTITNTGQLGPDSYDISTAVDPAAGWAVEVVDALGGDPINNSGTLDMGESLEMQVRVRVPAQASIHDRAVVTVTATSTNDPTRADSATATLAIPAPFVSAYMNMADGAMRLDYNEPAQQKTIFATANGVMGSNPAVTELPNGSIFYAWTVELNKCAEYLQNGTCYLPVSEIHYAVYSRTGALVSAGSKLADHTAASDLTTDRFPAVFAAPNGTVGMAFVRTILDASDSLVNNVYFQRFNTTGGKVGAAVNVTGNTAPNFPEYYEPAITTVTASRFMVAFSSSSVNYIDDVHTAVMDAGSGARIGAVARWTSDTAGVTPGYGSPALARLTGDRAVLAYHRFGAFGQGQDTAYYRVLNGSNAAPAAAVTLGAGVLPDVVQLSNGNVLFAWRYDSIRYAVFSSNFATVRAATALPPMANGNDMNPQVAADTLGNGLISWADSNSDEQFHFYYAVVAGSTGNRLVGPMIYKKSSTMLTSSDYGNGIASLTYNYRGSAGIDLSLNGETKIYNPLGDPDAEITIDFTNKGLSTANGVTLTATLPAGVSPISAVPGASCAGNSCTWTLDPVAFLEGGSITLNVQLPGGLNALPVSFTITTSGADTIPANNTRVVTIYPGSTTVVVPHVRK